MNVEVVGAGYHRSGCEVTYADSIQYAQHWIISVTIISWVA